MPEVRPTPEVPKKLYTAMLVYGAGSVNVGVMENVCPAGTVTLNAAVNALDPAQVKPTVPEEPTPTADTPDISVGQLETKLAAVTGIAGNVCVNAGVQVMLKVGRPVAGAPDQNAWYRYAPLAREIVLPEVSVAPKILPVESNKSNLL